MRHVVCTFAPWDDDEPYKEITKTVRIPDRATKNYWDQVTIGKALWKHGFTLKPKMMPVRIISMK